MVEVTGGFLLVISLIMFLYSIRHFIFGMNRLFSRQKQALKAYRMHHGRRSLFLLQLIMKKPLSVIVLNLC